MNCALLWLYLIIQVIWFCLIISQIHRNCVKYADDLSLLLNKNINKNVQNYDTCTNIPSSQIYRYH
jgi:hypothetical protein